MIKIDEAVLTLGKFLTMPISSTEEVFDLFQSIPKHKFHEGNRKSYDGQRFLYVPGYREDRVLLVAHADTVWDGQDVEQKIVLDNDRFKGKNSSVGIGADDRAGCAILWELRDSGHSLLILDGEESGRVGTEFLMTTFPEIAKELNEHQYILEFDRRNDNDYKVYNIPVTAKFKKFIEDNTGYTEPDKNSCTDIGMLCNKICGANLSVGYYNEHHGGEYIVIPEWLRTLQIVEKLLSEKQPKFLLSKLSSLPDSFGQIAREQNVNGMQVAQFPHQVGQEQKEEKVIQQTETLPKLASKKNSPKQAELLLDKPKEKKHSSSRTPTNLKEQKKKKK